MRIKIQATLGTDGKYHVHVDRHADCEPATKDERYTIVDNDPFYVTIDTFDVITVDP